MLQVSEQIRSLAPRTEALIRAAEADLDRARPVYLNFERAKSGITFD
jgi:hypothetical protein